MRDWLRSLLPDYWLMNNSYSAVWDARLRSLMSKHKFEHVDEYTARLGDVEVWIENHPYGSFSLYLPRKIGARPSRRTIAYAHRKLLADLFAE